MTAARFPARGIAIFDSRGRRRSWRSYPEVPAAAEETAARWRTLGAAPGDRILLALPTAWEFLDAWLGAVFAGALPVAVAPGAGMGAAGARIDRVEALIEQLGARFAVTSEAYRQAAADHGARRTAEVAVTWGEVSAAATAVGPPRRPQAEETAFLQLTSGSTGRPRAVEISHHAALRNAVAFDAAIHAPLGGAAAERLEWTLSWLPLNHDLGLVGGLIQSFAVGRSLCLLPSRLFLVRPELWLAQASVLTPAVTFCPNFGLNLCVERLAAKQELHLDLQGLRAMICGAEMVRRETLAAFQRELGPYGLGDDVVRPGYGLAEATVAVTVDCRGQGARTRPLPGGADRGSGIERVACCGSPVLDTRVRVVGPHGRARPDDEIGEVEVEGPGLFSGYFRDPRATAEAFTADGWLRTGDLGFLSDGELYLTGRSKDLLIIRGHNLMPEEFEWIAESVGGGGGTTRAGAFSVARDASGEQAVVVVETNDPDPNVRARLAHEIRDRIGRTLSLTLGDLVVVRRGTIPKTTSGKIRRGALRQLYLEGGLDARRAGLVRARDEEGAR